MNKLIVILSVFLLLFWGCSKKQEVVLQKELFLKRMLILEGLSITPRMVEEHKYSEVKLIESTYNNYYLTPSGSQIITNSGINFRKYTYADNLIKNSTVVTSTGEIALTANYEYDSKNRLIKAIGNFTGETEKIGSEYIYNAEGKLVEKKEYLFYPFPDYVIKFDYEPKNVVKCSLYDTNGVLFGELRTYFDGKNRASSLYPATGKGNIIKVVPTEKYKFVNGRISFIPKNEKYPVFSLSDQDIYFEYNQWGYPFKQIVTNKQDGTKLIYSYEYY